VNKKQAIEWFKAIQNGEGTYTARMTFLEEFGVGRTAETVWDDGVFTLGIEYGILIALSVAYSLSPNLKNGAKAG